jgi:hypothetical protein
MLSESASLKKIKRLCTDVKYLFSRPADIAVLRLAYKKGRELARRMRICRGELPSGNPSFPDGDAAISTDARFPIDISAPEIIYTPEDDKAIDKYHRDVGMWPVRVYLGDPT